MIGGYWTLYVKSAAGDWMFLAHCPTGDRCKTVAKKNNKTESRNNLGRKYLIRDTAGNNWMKSEDTGSWRMKWVYVKQGENP